MKVIPKLLGGGGFDPFFTIYTPVLVLAPSLAPTRRESSRRASSGDDDNTKGKLTERDLFTMLKDIDGLPNEMRALVNDLMNTFTLSSLTGIDTSDLATTYLSNLYLMKIAAQNKKKYDDALSNASTNGAMNEPAISPDGKLVVQDLNGSINTISLDSYFNNDGQYLVLTISNLAHLRAYDPSLNNNQTVFDIINNGVGFESFQKLLETAKQNLGTSENTRSGYFSNEGEASKGLRLLQTLSLSDQVQALGSVTAEGLYKYKIIDKTQLALINALTNYMLAVFPDRAKTWAALKLGTPNKDKATKDLILQYFLSSNSDSHSFDIQYEGSMEHVMGKTKDKEKSEEEPKMTYLTALLNGYGGRYETRTFNPGSQVGFKVHGTVYGGFMDTNGNTITDNNLADLLSKTGIAGITNTRSITFGDNYLNPNSLKHVAIENNGGFMAVLPCVKENGKVRPKFELIGKFDELLQQVNSELPNGKYEERQALLEKKIAGVPALQDLLTMTGKLDETKVAPFFIVDGIASDLNFSFMTNDHGKIVPISQKSSPIIKPTSDKEDEKYFLATTGAEDYDAHDNIFADEWFGSYNKLYRSNVFIPILTQNRLAAILFSGQKIKDSSALGIEGEYQKAEITGNMRTIDPNVLAQ